MSAATPARRAALAVLAAAEERGAYVRELLDRSDAVRALDARDAAFSRRLVLGVTAARGCLDDALDRFLAKPRKVSPRVRTGLRIAAFELIYLGTAPEAAVSQGVELVRSQARAAAGLANAVLHKVADGREGFLSALDVDDAALRRVASRARRAGLPVWLVGELDRSLGIEVADRLLASQLEPAPLAAYVLPGYLDSSSRCLDPCCSGASAQPMAPARSSEPELEPERAAGQRGAEGTSAPFPGGSVLVRDMPGFLAMGVLQRDHAVMSDLNAQRVAQLAVDAGSFLEVGAGRGIKTFIIAAEARRRGFAREHVAIDLYEGKCRENLERLKRAGLAAGVRALAGDGTRLDEALGSLDRAAGKARLFDTVLLDAPCSGTGTMRRHPEIPWRLSKRDVAEALPALQGRLLHEAARRVAPGGRLIYATCSVLARENDAVVEEFLGSADGRDFGFDEKAQIVSAPGAFDGHYHAVFRRRHR